MDAPSPRSGHQLTKEERAKGGKKSKRGASWKTVAKRMADYPVRLLPQLTKDKVFEETGLKLKKNMTLQQAVVARRFIEAIKGDNQAAVFLRDTADGKPSESVELSINDFTINLKDSAEKPDEPKE